MTYSNYKDNSRLIELANELQELYDAKSPKISFEFFPTKSKDAKQKQSDSIQNLLKFHPEFMSVTYGAGGSTTDGSKELIENILNNTNIPVAAHMTCVGSSKSETHDYAQWLWQIGVRHIVALRGDMPGSSSEDKYTPHPDGYHYADDLVAGLKKLHDFEISVAAYPESHPQAPNLDFDIDHLKRKIDAGAHRAITQYCFDNTTFLRYIDLVRAKGINAPIAAGILPIHNVSQMVSFSKKCGAYIPKWLEKIIANIDDTPNHRAQLAIHIALEQCRLLMLAGIDEFHFYTLNKSELTEEICSIILGSQTVK